MLNGLLVLALCFVIAVIVLLRQPKFGGSPKGERLVSIERSVNYHNDEFKNLIATPKFSQDVSLFSILWNDMRYPAQRLVPEQPLPATKTDLTAIDLSEDIVLWFGHSSYYIQLGGKRILIDPVFSSYAAPFWFLNRAFTGTSIYQAEDIPPIDYLLITHDHWDHLDYPSVTALKDKVRHVVCPLGIGSYLEDWGFAPDRIHEADWYEQLSSEDDLEIHVLPARHYSGRMLRQNKTLWAGFALISDERRLFFSGDSGYGPHFAEIGRKFGPFDLVALDCGQYNDRWAYIHMTPEEAVSAAVDLHAEALLPAHVGRFSISRHAWDDPFVRVSAASEGTGFKLLTPVIGEPVRLNDRQQQNTRWWESFESETLNQQTDFAQLKPDQQLKPNRASQ